MLNDLPASFVLGLELLLHSQHWHSANLDEHKHLEKHGATAANKVRVQDGSVADRGWSNVLPYLLVGASLFSRRIMQTFAKWRPHLDDKACNFNRDRETLKAVIAGGTQLEPTTNSKH